MFFIQDKNKEAYSMENPMLPKIFSSRKTPAIPSIFCARRSTETIKMVFGDMRHLQCFVCANPDTLKNQVEFYTKQDNWPKAERVASLYLGSLGKRPQKELKELILSFAAQGQMDRALVLIHELKTAEEKLEACVSLWILLIDSSPNSPTSEKEELPTSPTDLTPAKMPLQTRPSEKSLDTDSYVAIGDSLPISPNVATSAARVEPALSPKHSSEDTPLMKIGASPPSIMFLHYVLRNTNPKFLYKMMDTLLQKEEADKTRMLLSLYIDKYLSDQEISKEHYPFLALLVKKEPSLTESLQTHPQAKQLQQALQQISPDGGILNDYF